MKEGGQEGGKEGKKGREMKLECHFTHYLKVDITIQSHNRQIY